MALRKIKGLLPSLDRHLAWLTSSVNQGSALLRPSATFVRQAGGITGTYPGEGLQLLTKSEGEIRQPNAFRWWMQSSTCKQSEHGESKQQQSASYPVCNYPSQTDSHAIIHHNLGWIDRLGEETPVSARSWDSLTGSKGPAVRRPLLVAEPSSFGAWGLRSLHCASARDQLPSSRGLHHLAASPAEASGESAEGVSGYEVAERGSLKGRGVGSGRPSNAAHIGYSVIGKLEGELDIAPKAVFAVVQVGSHQFKVTPGDAIYVEKLQYADINEKLALGKVLLLGSKESTTIGRPTIPGAQVVAAVEEHALDEKVIVFKKKRRKNYRRHRGHRQELTRLRILDIMGIEESEEHTSKQPAIAA